MSDYNLEQFIYGYAQCLLWEGVLEEDNFETDFTVKNFSDELKQTIKADCEDYYHKNKALLAKTNNPNYQELGHDFLLTRNGHGAGFWDKGYGDVGDKLTDNCLPYGSFDVYIGDDGKIYG
jgi:hypothetical protein